VTATASVRPSTGAAQHPLDQPTAEEFSTVREVLAEAGQLGDAVRVCFAALEEPPKAEVLAHADGDPVDRRFGCCCSIWAAACPATPWSP
jgi:primary-amine oxidase